MSLRYGIHLGALHQRSWVDAAAAADSLGFDLV
jgi:hypothetical protein